MTSPAPTRRKTKVILAGVVIAPIMLFVLYTLFALNWSYSDGYRAGILQKFSKKGWVCKTWEGELAQSVVTGVAPTIWTFSSRDEESIRALSAAVGKRVRLHYQEHRGLPTSCFGETDYFVDGMSFVEGDPLP